jgi:glycosyltransferase involved in cell wall biosynthesis
VISVVIPFRNAALTLERCVKNLIIPQNAGIEIIAVDDASEDGSARLLELKRDAAERVGVELQVHRSPTRRGAGAGRNFGIRRANRDWICFVDADDMVSPSHISLLRGYADDGLDFLRTFHVSFADGNVRGPAIDNMTMDMIERPLNPRRHILPVGAKTLVDYPYSWAGLYRTKFLRENNINFQEIMHAEDRLFTWKLHLYGRVMKFLPLSSYFYAREANGITASRGIETLDVFSAFKAILEELDGSGD